MENREHIKLLKENGELYVWCLEQASARYQGILSQEKIDKLNSIGFDWVYYENALDEIGYSWKSNNPNGLRYKDKNEKDAS